MRGRTGGWVSGFVGVAIFSGSLPATRVAVMDFDPVFLTVARATIAGALAVALLVAGLVALPLNHWLIGRGKGHAVVHATGVHG